jgi:hypothetical protein
LISLIFLLVGCTPGVSKLHILVIGDDYAADKSGWVYYFQQLRSGGPIVNLAVKGSTIGFPSPKRPELNTLNNLVPYLRKGFAEMGAIDEVIIQLGTNDCRTNYQALNVERDVNLREVIDGIAAFFVERGQEVPRILLVSPPPLADNDQQGDAFENSGSCIAELSNSLRRLADREGLCYVDLGRVKELGSYQNKNGITYQSRGAELMAKAILDYCF